MDECMSKELVEDTQACLLLCLSLPGPPCLWGRSSLGKLGHARG